MAGKLIISYDRDGDMLEIAFGSTRQAVAEELISNLFVRYDLATYNDEKNEGKDIIGFTIANISLWDDDDFHSLDELFSNDMLRETIRWVKNSLVGKSIEIVAA
jgi:hypothetical protein